MSSSSTAATTVDNNMDKEITMEIPYMLRIYKEGTIQRLQDTPIVPPTIEDQTTKVSSKDVIISHNPPISARLYLQNRVRSQEKDLKKVPILVYFHGGGFFFESAFNQRHQNYFNSFVSEANVIVVSVEYRLAPETPLPAAYEDCWEALKWVATNTNTDTWLEKHGDFNRVFIGGDSAGANIAHNIAMRAGVEDLPNGVKIFGAVISHSYFYGSKPIGAEPDEGHEQSVPFVVWNFVYPSAPGGVDNPMVNPLADGAPSLAGIGCSKILVCVAEMDLVKVRSVLYYEALKKSGWQGEVELFEVKNEDHAFHVHDPQSENGKKMIKRIADFLLQ